MECIRPLKAGFDSTGTIVYSTKKMSRELVPFAFPCRKCLPCRLNIAREKAIRCYHEAQSHDDNLFLTLTYNDESLVSKTLQYSDFQNFMKRLRKTTDQKITFMVTGEYGEKNKRPHWHALVFNYAPKDAEKKYVTDHGEQVYSSKFLEKLWGKGTIEYGSLTIESAGYVARYAAKKLVHGKDEDHNYHPIHKTSSKRAIGRSWIEKHYKHAFAHGFIVLPNGSRAKIPRYYLDWLKKYKPIDWENYISGKKTEIQALAEKMARRDELDYIASIFSYKPGRANPLTRSQVKETILKSKFKLLQERLKL